MESIYIKCFTGLKNRRKKNVFETNYSMYKEVLKKSTKAFINFYIIVKSLFGMNG